MLSQLKNTLRNRRLAQHRRPTQANGRTNLDTAKAVVLLFPAGEVNGRKTANAWAEKHRNGQRKIQLVGYLPAAAADPGFPTLHPGDKNWYGAFHGPTYDTFRAEPCDLLLRLGPPTHPELDFLAAVKPAALKVGPYHERSDYDLQYDGGGRSATFADQLRAIESIFRYTNAATT